MDLKSVFKNKRIFITGHTGFKGGWLVMMLHHLGANIKGFANEIPQGGVFEKAGVQILCQQVKGDIRDAASLKNELLEWEPDFVFHLAAQPLVLQSYQDPVETFDVNTMGTVYLLDSLRALRKPCVTLIITTDKVYENQEWHYPYRETDRLGGDDPYSASKAAAELIVASYRQSYFNHFSYDKHQQAVASVRAGNVIGGGDVSSNRIIPDIVQALQSAATVALRHPGAIRPWQHVLEALHGYLTLAAALASNPADKALASAWNFGPVDADVLTVEELTKLAIDCWGAGTYEVQDKYTHKLKETYNLCLSIAKARFQLGWQPRWNSSLAVQYTIDWYKMASTGGTDLQAYSLQQINDYLYS